MPLEIDLSARWRALAVEAIGLARQLPDRAAKDAMLLIAQKYLALAELAVDARCQHRLDLAGLRDPASGPEDPVNARPPDAESFGDVRGAKPLPLEAADLGGVDAGLAASIDAPLLRRGDPLQLPLAPKVGLDSAKTPNMSKNALPAAVEVSMGCSVARR